MKKIIKKSDPGSSSVHVNVPIGSDNGKKKKKPKPAEDATPPAIDNLEVTAKSDGADPATADDSDPIDEDDYEDMDDDMKLVYAALGFQVAKAKPPVEVQIAKADKAKQIVYGAVLVPNEVDSQGDVMKAEDIEKAAHHYMVHARVVGSNHSRPITATPVESYIAPTDMEFDSPYGIQKIAKGSWILAVKINDAKEWEKVEKGEYKAFSVGGTGVREPLTSKS